VPCAGDAHLAVAALLALPSGREALQALRGKLEGAGFAQLQRLVLLGCFTQHLRLLAAAPSGPGAPSGAAELLQLLHQGLGALQQRVAALAAGGLGGGQQNEMAVAQELQAHLAAAADAR
jgi:hypothetical protein